MSSYGDLWSFTKFSRDDDQIFALNYENLCDIEYLNKLFSNEPPIESDQLSDKPWLLTPDLPEDILLFSEQVEIGLQFIRERLLHENVNHCRILDSHADVILRQIKVFAHIGRMVILRCHEHSHIERLTKKCDLHFESRMPCFLPSALTCGLQKIHNKGKGNFSRSCLNSILSLMSDVFGRNSTDSLSSNLFKISPGHAHVIRSALCSGMHTGLSIQTTSAEEILQALKLTMSYAFCLFRFGLQSHSSGDVLLALAHMLAVSVCVEDKRIELDAKIGHKDCDNYALEKNRMMTKFRDNRVLQKYPAAIPPQSSETILSRDSVSISSFDVKLPFEKSSWSRPIINSANGKDWKSKIQVKKSAVRPEQIFGEGEKQGKSLAINVTPADIYPVTSWRCSTGSDNFTEKVIPAVISECATSTKSHHVSLNYIPLSQSNPLPYQSSEGVHFHRKTSDLLENLNVIPPEVVREVNDFCAMSKDSGDVHDCSELTSKTTAGLSKTSVWTCGQNSYGELGHGDVSLRRSFSKSIFFDDKNILCVGAGNEHSVFVSSSGKTFVAGYNDNGQCGIGTTQQVRQPALVSFLEDEEISKVYVFNGCEHTLVVTREGKMFSFGYNYRGQLGVGNTCSEPVPRPIRSLMSRKVTLAACSYHHSIVACADGAIYSFGRNDCGQLGMLCIVHIASYYVVIKVFTLQVMETQLTRRYLALFKGYRIPRQAYPVGNFTLLLSQCQAHHMLVAKTTMVSLAWKVQR